MSNNEQLFAEIIPTEEANLSGGRGGAGRHRTGGYNDASAGATADAIGFNTYTDTYTDAFVVQGERSSSTSYSTASAYH